MASDPRLVMKDGVLTANPERHYDSPEDFSQPRRPSWDDYYLGIAEAVAKRADCSRRQVGAILVNAGNRHRGSGYNGGRSKGPSCLAGECPRSTSGVAPGSSYDTGKGVCIAIHSEQNLIMDTTPADRLGGTVYITDEPCDGCLRMLQGSGVIRIVWPKGRWRQTAGKNWVKTGPRGETYFEHP